MHGTVLFHLHRYAERTWGQDAWSQLFAKAGLAEKSYSPVGVHPDEDMVALVNAAAELTGLAAIEILTRFGEYLAPELVAIYPSLIDSDWRTLDLIANAEQVIHEAVRAQKPESSPPILRAQMVNPHEVHLVYASPRMMCSLLKGIVKGVSNHYGENIRVIEESCMLEGSPFCSIVFQKVGDSLANADTATISNSIAPSSAHWTGKGDKSPVGDVTEPLIIGNSDFNAQLKFPGEHRIGGYQIVDLLGSGGMGEVYLAQDTVLNRWVALKVLPVEKSSVETRQRFLDEARSMASINHEHIVSIYHVGDDDGTPYIVMPRLIGATLEDWMKEGNRPSIEHALLIVFQTLTALDVAHKMRLLHRDVKPANIWLEAPKGKVKLMDFGLSRAIQGDDVGRLTDSQTLVCTPLYMPPEGLSGDTDERSDLYSLGVVAYEMLTGTQPFADKTVEGIFVKIASHLPPPPQELVDDIPLAVGRFVMRLMSNQPAKRPASAFEAMHEVQQLFSGLKQGRVHET
jgi:predicted hydrocarbon binding protein